MCNKKVAGWYSGEEGGMGFVMPMARQGFSGEKMQYKTRESRIKSLGVLQMVGGMDFF